MSLLVGIDIGGSGLRLQVVRDGVPGVVRVAEGVQITATGIDVDALIRSATTLLSQELPEPPTPDVVVWSMRGLLMLSDPESVLASVATGLRGRQTVVCTDALTSLVGAVGSVRPGAVVAAGTGAVAFGTDFDTTWRRVDGWGHVLGDRGSGAWVGLEGLRAALRTRDGVSTDGPALLEAAIGHFGPPEGWARIVMTRADVPAQLAGFAPRVAELAESDPAALQICEGAGTALAAALESAARGIDGATLATTGGLFGAAALRRAFDAACDRAGLTVTPAVGSSLDGAVHLAGHLHAGRPLTAHPPHLVATR